MHNSRGTIVYIGGMEMPDGNAAAHRALNNSKIFAELGYNVVFCGMDRFIKENAKTPLILDSYLSFPMKYPKNGKEWAKQLIDFAHIKYVLEEFDDVKFTIAYNMHAIPLKNLLRYCKKRNIKVLADITEWYQNDFSIKPIKLIKWFDTNWVMKKLHKKVDGIISISSFLTEYYKKSVSNIIQLPPLVDLDEPIWNKEIYNTDSKEGCVTFTYAGVPGSDKDKLNLIIKSFYELRTLDYKFNVYGLTKELFLVNYPEYSELINELSSKICFWGRVSHLESIKSLLTDDYCIFIREPSRKNNAGFPTKFVEAYTGGIGIIANKVSNISDYYPKEKFSLIDNISIKSISNAICYAIKAGKTNHKINNTFNYNFYTVKMKEFIEKV